MRPTVSTPVNRSSSLTCRRAPSSPPTGRFRPICSPAISGRPTRAAGLLCCPRRNGRRATTTPLARSSPMTPPPSFSSTRGPRRSVSPSTTRVVPPRSMSPRVARRRIRCPPREPVFAPGPLLRHGRHRLRRHHPRLGLHAHPGESSLDCGRRRLGSRQRRSRYGEQQPGVGHRRVGHHLVRRLRR